MRAVTFSGVLAAAAGMAAVPAMAQQASVDSYLCQLTPEACVDGVDASTAKDREGQRAFSLGRAAPAAAPRADVRAKPAAYAAASTRAAPAPGARAQARVAAAVAPVSRNDMRINFLNGSAELTPGARVNAQMIAQAMNKAPAGKRFLIEGHTNRVGTAESNLKLSQARAEALVSFLVANGVDASRLEAKGVGFDRPLPNRAPVAPENRRVEARAIS
jgi:OOP family OmpA-OmpF porin